MIDRYDDHQDQLDDQASESTDQQKDALPVETRSPNPSNCSHINRADVMAKSPR